MQISPILIPRPSMAIASRRLPSSSTQPSSTACLRRGRYGAERGDQLAAGNDVLAARMGTMSSREPVSRSPRVGNGGASASQDLDAQALEVGVERTHRLVRLAG